MSDENKLLTTNVKIIIVAVIIFFIGLIIFVEWSKVALYDNLDQMSCEELKEYSTNWFDQSKKKTIGIQVMVEKFNEKCDYLGKFFLEEVENVGLGLVFIPASEMQDGVQYEIQIKTNRTDLVVEQKKGFNIEIGK